MFFGLIEIENPVQSANLVQDQNSKSHHKDNEIIIAEKMFRNEHSTAIIHETPLRQKTVLVINNNNLDVLISAIDADIKRRMENERISFAEAYNEVYAELRCKGSFI